MDKSISIIIPNYNGNATIGKCLESAFSSRYGRFEVVVVDDCSTDDSIETIKKFPCKFIQLDKHSGTSKARNTGAKNSDGEILFFIDSDCLLQENTLAIVNKTIPTFSSENIIIGGTYTRIPYDDNFFSIFQSIFVNYFETKKKEPDYIAAHAMIIDAQLFKDSGGFVEDYFIPIIEDVEFSHRLRRAGCKLVMNPEILVQHIFNFSLIGSLRNAVKKSLYWTMYSIQNRDLLADSGTASVELKINVASCLSNLLLVLLGIATKSAVFLIPVPLIFAFNIFISRKLLRAFYETKGLSFTILVTLYYTILYPLAVGAGTVMGTIKLIMQMLSLRAKRSNL